MLRDLCCILALSATVGACATYPEESERRFGDSVRHMIEVQTYTPSAEVPPLLGDKAAAVMDAHRTDVTKPEEVSQELLQIQVGN